MKRDLVYYKHCKEVLSKSPLFTGLAEELLDDMLLMFRRDNWRRGLQLDPGIFQERFYLLIEGRLEVMRINPKSGKSVTLYLLAPGDGVDIVTLLNSHPHEVMSVALDDITLLSVPIVDVRYWIEHHPDFNRNFLPYLGEQMRKMEDLATDLALHETMTRLARLLLRHIAPGHPQSGNGNHHLRLIHDLHDDSLARMVGSVRQVVNRHLQHWRKLGILHKQNFQTEIVELESLQGYAEEVAAKRETQKKVSGVS